MDTFSPRRSCWVRRIRIVNRWCRLGFHRWVWRTLIEDSVYGHESVTRRRCDRPDCPKHLWWALMDAEPTHPEIPAHVNEKGEMCRIGRSQ